MKIYFAASTSGLPKNKSLYKQIIQILSKDNQVLDSWVTSYLANKKSNLTSQELIREEAKIITKADLIVAEVSTPSLGVGYLIGQALSSRKPLLCLFNNKHQKASLSDILSGTSSSLLTLRKYNSKNISKIINNYLKNFKFPTYSKFNFIITPEIDEYITSGAKLEKKSKSEFLRDKIVRKLIDES